MRKICADGAGVSGCPMGERYRMSAETHLLLLPLGLEALLHLTGRLEVLAKGLLDDDAVDAVLGVVVLLKVGSDDGKDRGRQGHVEDAVLRALLVGVGLLAPLQLLFELDKALVGVVLAGDIGAQLEELVQLLLHGGDRGLDVLRDARVVVLLLREA